MENYDNGETPEIVDIESDAPRFNWKRELWEWTQSLAFALVIVMLVRTFLFTLVLVDGPSMEPTLSTRDRLYVNKFMYTPQNGDIVVFTPQNHPRRPFIKRVIAIPGQTLEIDFENARVIVNGEVLREEYINMPTTRRGDVKFPITIPEGYFFAMGDNRSNSQDSRDASVGDNDNDMGLISKDRLMGKALFRVWPFNKFGRIY